MNKLFNNFFRGKCYRQLISMKNLFILCSEDQMSDDFFHTGWISFVLRTAIITVFLEENTIDNLVNIYPSEFVGIKCLTSIIFLLVFAKVRLFYCIG